MLPLVSHAEYAPRVQLKWKKTGQADGRKTVTVTLCLLIDAASVKCKYASLDGQII